MSEVKVDNISDMAVDELTTPHGRGGGYVHITSLGRVMTHNLPPHI